MVDSFSVGTFGWSPASSLSVGAFGWSVPDAVSVLAPLVKRGGAGRVRTDEEEEAVLLALLAWEGYL